MLSPGSTEWTEWRLPDGVSRTPRASPRSGSAGCGECSTTTCTPAREDRVGGRSDRAWSFARFSRRRSFALSATSADWGTASTEGDRSPLRVLERLGGRISGSHALVLNFLEGFSSAEILQTIFVKYAAGLSKPLPAF